MRKKITFLKLLFLAVAMGMSVNGMAQVKSLFINFEGATSADFTLEGTNTATVTVETNSSLARSGSKYLKLTGYLANTGTHYKYVSGIIAANNEYIHEIQYLGSSSDQVNAVAALSSITVGYSTTPTMVVISARDISQRSTNTKQNVSGANVEVFPRLRSKPGATFSNNFYVDDIVIYASTIAAVDLTAPTAPSNLAFTSQTSTSNALSWTQGSDASTGIQKTYVLRTTNASASTPVLLQNVAYSVAGGAAGINTIGDWTVIAVENVGTTTYTDNFSEGSPTYYYAVAHRDLAYNNSASAEMTKTIDANTTISTNTTYTGKVVVSPSVTLTIDNGFTLSLAAGAQLTNNGTITNNGTLSFLSDATNGTATLTGDGIIDGTGTKNINQSLQHPSSALRTWYASSPFAANIAPTPALTTIKTFNEGANSWSATTLTEMEAKKGYLVVPADAANNLLFSSTGDLNAGDLDVDLTGRDGVGANQGFNLVGNPYPSYLDWKAIYDYTLDAGATYPNRDSLRSVTMWYRTKTGGAYSFETVNGEGVGSPSTASRYIPPMQGFWVRSAVGTPTLKLTNAMRTHAPAANKLLKAPALDNRTLLRLQVSNGVNSDETVLYLSENAQNGLDKLDAPKMYNTNMEIPQIYTTLANENYVINSMNTLPLDAPIGLGFMAGNASSFTLKANEISNLPEGVKVILRDNVNSSETDLTDGTASYNFSKETLVGDRFSLIFRSPSGTTGIETQKLNVSVVKNGNNQLIVNAGSSDKGQITILNALGQKLKTTPTTGNSTVINHQFESGVYIITLEIGTLKVNQKFILN